MVTATQIADLTADELSDLAAISSVTKISSRLLPGLDRKPGKSNWVDAAGGLPDFVDRIARHLHHERGMTISHAIAAAIEQVKKWAAGGGNVKPDTRAKAAKAVAEWEAMKLRAKAKRLAKSAVPVAYVTEGGGVYKVTEVDGDDVELELDVDKAANSYEAEARVVRRKRRRKNTSPHAFKAGRWTTRKGIARCLDCGWGQGHDLHGDDVSKALSDKDQAAVDAETERIKVSREGPGSKPHTFKPAQWTHPNGHPRCRVCGQEQPVSGRCNGHKVTKDLGALGSWTGADATQDGVMVALFLDPAVAHALAIEGGEDPDQLHITLGYLGKVDDQAVDRATVARVVSSVAGRFERFTGRINGIGRFEADDRGDGWPLVAFPDIPRLSEFREALVSALRDVGVNVYANHGFTAHTTLAYVKPADEGDAARILAEGIDGINVSFGTVTLAWGPDRFEAPFGGQVSGIPDSDYPSPYVVKAVAGPLVESDESKHYTFAPWYPAAPETVTAKDLDAHGEFVTAPDIQEMVWDYVRAGDRDLRLQHVDGTKIGEWVELACIPAPMTVDLALPGGEKVTKTFAAGTPFMGAVWNDVGWRLVEDGAITGFSFGGRSQKMAVDVAE